MRATENERRDWAVIAFILLFGLCGILSAGGWALRFASHWELDANVESKLDPNSDFLTNKPVAFIEPVDPAILTNPAWIDAALTPGASFSTNTQHSTATSALTTSTPGTPITTQITQTVSAFASSTATALASPTNTPIYVPPYSTLTSRPNPESTSTPTPTTVTTGTGMPTSTATSTTTSTGTAVSASSPTSTATDIATSTQTPTSTPTGAVISTPTSTPTNTPDLSEPDFGGPDGNTILLGNGTWIEFNLGGFLLDGNSTWDVVYYEKEETSSAGKIHLGAVRIEVYDSTTSAWYTIYYWGDGNPDGNASYDNGNAEPDGFPVNKSLLYGVSPLNTGIAIDIDSAAIAQGGNSGDSITKIRITSLSNSDCDTDSLQMLR